MIWHQNLIICVDFFFMLKLLLFHFRIFNIFCQLSCWGNRGCHCFGNSTIKYVYHGCIWRGEILLYVFLTIWHSSDIPHYDFCKKIDQSSGKTKTQCQVRLIPNVWFIKTGTKHLIPVFYESDITYWITFKNLISGCAFKLKSTTLITDQKWTLTCFHIS